MSRKERSPLTSEEMKALRLRSLNPNMFVDRSGIRKPSDICKYMVKTCCGKPNLCTLTGAEVDRGICENCEIKETGVPIQKSKFIATPKENVEQIKKRFIVCKQCEHSLEDGFACALYNKGKFTEYRKGINNTCPDNQWD